MKTLRKSLASQNDRILIDFQFENSFQESFPFSTASVSGKKVRVAFRGGSVSSNAGVLLLRETERQVGREGADVGIAQGVALEQDAVQGQVLKGAG